MRKTRELEIIGIGKVKEYPVRTKRKKFKRVSEEGKEVKRKSEGTKNYFWTDNEGKKYENDEIFYLIGDKKIQKVPKKEKVKNWEKVDKMKVMDLANVQTSILDCSETTLENFNREVGDKAIHFRDKKSSRGMKWVRSYIFKQKGRLIKVDSDGITREQGIKKFEEMGEKKGKVKSKVKNLVEVKSEDIEGELEEEILA